MTGSRTLGDRYDAAAIAIGRARAILSAIVDADMLDHLNLKGDELRRVNDASILVIVALEVLDAGVEASDI